MSGNVWMFSDEIDDEDLEFMSHDYVTYNMACEYYRLGIKPVVRMAHEAGAVLNMLMEDVAISQTAEKIYWIG